jgi:hypothetical protein
MFYSLGAVRLLCMWGLGSENEHAAKTNQATELLASCLKMGREQSDVANMLLIGGTAMAR